MVKNTVSGVTCSVGRMSPFVAPAAMRTPAEHHHIGSIAFVPVRQSHDDRDASRIASGAAECAQVHRTTLDVCLLWNLLLTGEFDPDKVRPFLAWLSANAEPEGCAE